MKRTLGIVCIVFLLTSSITLCSQKESEQKEYALGKALGSAVGDRAVSRIFKSDIIQNESNLESLVGVGAFVLADYAIVKTAQAVGDHDSVKKATNVIREEHRPFVWGAGRGAIRSTLSRVAMIMLRCGVISNENMDKLRVHAISAVVSKAITHYAAKPLANQVFGKKKGIMKTLFTVTSAGVIIFVINQLLRSMASSY